MLNAGVLTSSGPPDAAHQAEWRPLEADPGHLVFLLGCQRSGTTWLHLQLARSRAFRFLTAYDVYANETLVYNWRHGLSRASREAFAGYLVGNSGDRGIDAIPAGPDTPEEYGLVIAGLVDGTGGSFRYDQPDTTEATLPKLRELCAKKALIEGRDRPLLLKSPPDYPRGAACLTEAWPSAKFVVIQRHPLWTLQSQLNAWRDLVVRKNVYLSLIDGGYRTLFEDPRRRLALGMFLHSQAGVDWLADCILRAHLGFLSLGDRWAADIFTLRYEDLCADQNLIFARLASFFQMDLADPQHVPSPRNGAVSEEARRSFEARRSEFTPYLERYGYGAEFGTTTAGLAS
jgi:Sulfotransferase family